MKTYIIALSVCAAAIFSTSCRDKNPETTTIVKDVPVEKEVKVEVPVQTKNEGILERAGQKVDDKVNHEIDKKIDDIGND